MSPVATAWRGLRLGTRLALALGVLALVVFGLVGAITVSVMRESLLHRLDSQLDDLQVQYRTSQLTPRPTRPSNRDTLVGVVYRFGDDGAPVAVESTNLPSDTSMLEAMAKSVHTGSRAARQTVWLAGNEYRALAISVPGRVRVLAISQEETEHTIKTLALVEALTFFAALAVLVGAGAAVLRRGLQPLGDMAFTAHEIASTDLTARSVDLSTRAEGTGGGLEVEELRTAFNVMLAHIDESLAARSAAEQRLRQFVADASHELRTPLTSIRGYADLFAYAAANEPAERDRLMGRMREEAGRMSALLDDLLLLARLDATETPLRPERVDLVELAMAAAEGFHAGRPEHPLSFDSQVDSLRLDADPMRLRQVLDNLLTNGAVHTEPGTAVALRVRAEPGWAVVEVADAGPGISEQDQARVFDRFYRVDDSRTRGSGGTGLGLSVVHSLVAAHGGTVSLTSRPGDTVFTVRLPSASLVGGSPQVDS
ncbi:HAMP domain-containing sensor histidine kinase [Kutzneria viridogrisea]